MKRVKYIVIFVVIIILIVILWSLTEKNSKKSENINNLEQNDTTMNENINEDMQNYYDDTIKDAKFELKDQYENIVNIEEYRGQKVILFFWRIWCPPCQRELGTIADLYNDLGNNEKDVILLTLTQPKTGKEDDEGDKTIEEIKEYINENNYDFPVLFDEEKTVFREFDAMTVPTIMVIDEQGNEIYKRSSSEIDVEEVMSYLN